MVTLIKINGTGKVCALLSERMVITIKRAHEDSGVFRCGVPEVQRRARSQYFGTFNPCGGKSFSASCIECGLPGKSCCTDEERSRSKSKEVAKLPARDLSLFVAIIGEVALVRSCGFAHIAFIATAVPKDLFNSFIEIRTHCSCPFVQLANRSMIQRRVAVRL